MKIIFGTQVQDASQKTALDKVGATNRMVSYFYLKEGKDSFKRLL